MCRKKLSRMGELMGERDTLKKLILLLNSSGKGKEAEAISEVLTHAHDTGLIVKILRQKNIFGDGVIIDGCTTTFGNICAESNKWNIIK